MDLDATRGFPAWACIISDRAYLSLNVAIVVVIVIVVVVLVFIVIIIVVVVVVGVFVIIVVVVVVFYVVYSMTKEAVRISLKLVFFATTIYT